MILTNTLTGVTEKLESSAGDTVGIYVCGITPYDHSHIGHATSAIVYDVLVRYLRWRGFTVTYVSNYTDVDDRLIERGHQLNRDPLEIAQEHIAEWESEQHALNLLETPDERPRVSEHIVPIIDLVTRIIERGHAYATKQGNVYFRVQSKSDYGKLSHRNLDDLLSGTRFEPGEDKEFALDFALWKAAKPGEPQWPSPWGAGRPGWHIECSAMSQRYLGDAFDIHGGGIDLIFPHHENEIAQSEVVDATGEPTFAQLWMHNGLVQRDGEKMSKSIGNVITVHEALSRWSPDAIRLFVLTGHYRSTGNVTNEAMAAAQRRAVRLARAMQRATEHSGAGDPLPTESYREAFVNSMERDFGTPGAIATLDDLAHAINRQCEIGHDVEEAANTFQELASVLGLTLPRQSMRTSESEDDADVLDGGQTSVLHAHEPQIDFLEVHSSELAILAKKLDVESEEYTSIDRLNAILSQRSDARAQKKFQLADEIRMNLLEIGIQLEDQADETTWSLIE